MNNQDAERGIKLSFPKDEKARILSLAANVSLAHTTFVGALFKQRLMLYDLGWKLDDAAKLRVMLKVAPLKEEVLKEVESLLGEILDKNSGVQAGDTRKRKNLSGHG